jgi:tetratricopeptide (TPR) repeat protein
MRNPPFDRVLPVLLIAFLTLAAVNSLVGTAWGAQAPALSEADMTYFYKEPSPARVAALVTYFDSLRAAERGGTRPPLMGFFAGAFQRYPADIDRMIPEPLSVQMMGLLAVSLKLAGQQARAESLVKTIKSRDAVAPDLSTLPPTLDAIEPVGPSELDLLWGASFATADPKYPSRILARFARVANTGDYAEDLVHVVRNLQSGADQQWLVDKRGKAAAPELIVASTALWALHSNALQHQFVRSVVDDYIAAHPSEPAAKALASLAQEYGYYQLAKLASVTEAAPGKSSVTVNLSFLTQVVDDLGRHAGGYPANFEFAEDRQRAVNDVTAISKMLDPLTDNSAISAPILLRLAVLHTIGFNLDVPDSFPAARTDFDKLLALTPEDPQANFRYGAFLAATTRKGEGIPYLEKARSLGVANADYWLGFSYEGVGNKAKAVENLEAYTKRVPDDVQAAAVLDAIRNDKFEFKTLKPGETP